MTQKPKYNEDIEVLWQILQIIKSSNPLVPRAQRFGTLVPRAQRFGTLVPRAQRFGIESLSASKPEFQRQPLLTLAPI